MYGPGPEGDENVDGGEPNEFVVAVPVVSWSVALAKWRSSAIGSIDVDGAGDIEPECNDIIDDDDAVK